MADPQRVPDSEWAWRRQGLEENGQARGPVRQGTSGGQTAEH